MESDKAVKRAGWHSFDSEPTECTGVVLNGTGNTYAEAFKSFYLRRSVQTVTCLLPRADGSFCGAEISDRVGKGHHGYLQHLHSMHPFALPSTYREKLEDRKAGQLSGIKRMFERPTAQSEATKAQLTQQLAVVAARTPVPISFFTSEPFRDLLVALGVISSHKQAPCRTWLTKAIDTVCAALMKPLTCKH